VLKFDDGIQVAVVVLTFEPVNLADHHILTSHPDQSLVFRLYRSLIE
jgi:hypothetical protein